MLGRSSTQKQLQLSLLKHQQLPPQIHFSTLTHDNQITTVHYLVQHENVLLSQKDDCHPILVDFGNDQFCSHINDRGANIVFKPLVAFSFEAVQPFQSQYRKPIKKNSITVLQQTAILNNTHITDEHDDTIEKSMIFFL